MKKFTTMNAHSLARTTIILLFFGLMAVEISAQTVVDTQYGPFSGSRFGSSIDISPSGEYVIAGAPDDDFFGLNRGLVVVGQMTEDGIVQIGQPLTGIANGIEFGYSVGVTDDATVFIGSRFDGETHTSGGSVTIYSYNQGNDTFEIVQKINSQQANEQFGWALDTTISGDALAASAVTYDYNQPGNGVTGLVRVYTLNVGGTYDNCPDITYNAEATNVEFGSDVSIEKVGDNLMVAVTGPKESVNGTNGAGIAQVFSNDLTCSGPWQQVGQTLEGEQEFQDFGYSVSLNGGVLAVGSIKYDVDEIEDAGSVHVYEYDDIGMEWVQLGTTLTGMQPAEYFGDDVAMASNGNTLVVGASQYDAEPPFVNHGKVVRYVYDEASQDWVQTGSDVTGYRASFLGSSVAVNSNGQAVVGGAPLDSETNNVNGKIYYISFEDPVGPVTVNYVEGWNMVSLPVAFAHNDYSEVFPASLPNTLYSFDGTYAMQTTLEQGTGYWVRMNADNAVEFDSEAPQPLELTLMDGWNLIGGLIVNAVVEDPNNIVDEQTLYIFDGGYQIVDTMEPGKAYWIVAEQAGVISVVPAP